MTVGAALVAARAGTEACPYTGYSLQMSSSRS